MKGKSLLENRQKLIKMADCSPYGWEVVKVYETNELVDGSDDEKRIQKAEKAAEKRLSERKKSNFHRYNSVASYRPPVRSTPYVMLKTTNIVSGVLHGNLVHSP